MEAGVPITTTAMPKVVMLADRDSHLSLSLSPIEIPSWVRGSPAGDMVRCIVKVLFWIFNMPL